MKSLQGVTGVALLALLAAGGQGFAQEALPRGEREATSQAMQKPVPQAAAPQQAYAVHPGDELTITFRYTPEFNEDVFVQPDGHVNLKSTGDIRVQGLSLPEIEREVVRDSSTRLVNPEVTVSLKDFVRPHFVVAGEVQLPGKFDLRQPTTVLGALLLAGGPKDDAALRHVYVFRRISSTDAQVFQLRMDRYNLVDLRKNDMALQADDMILVQRDALEKIGRIVKLFNVGLYLNPLPQNGLW